MITEKIASDCSPLDVAEAEKTVLKIKESVQDLVVNVDISNI